MGLAAAHQPRFRVFCCLLAAFWAAMILVGAVRLACAAAPYTPPFKAAAPHAVYRCPMCAAMAHAGMHMGGTQMAGIKPGTKCCCCTGGTQFASCVCRCRPQAAATLTVLVWSPLAVLPDKLGATPPSWHARLYLPLFPRLGTLACAPLPRPPRLL